MARRALQLCLAVVVVGAGAQEGAHVVFVENGIAVTRGRYGLHATPLSDTVVGSHLRELGEWEQPIMDVCAEILRGGAASVWEVGGHVGAHALGLARLADLLHTWEPQASPRTLLSASLGLNGLAARVEVHGEALGATSGGRVDVRCGAGEPNSGVCVLPPSEAESVLDFAEAAPRTSPARTLDDLRAGGAISGPCPALIKSDAEGADLAVLEGARNTIAACRPALLFELVQPKKRWRAVATGLLARHPSYACAYLIFRIVPAKADSFRFPDLDPDAGGLGDEAKGPMSYNLLCTPDGDPLGAAPVAAAKGLLRKAPNAILYAAADCRDYERALRDLGAYAQIVGLDAGTICQ